MTGNLLAIPPKTSPLASSALAQAVRTHIAENFRDAHPDAFKRDLKTLAELRDQVAAMDGHSSGVATALKYHAQLVFMSTKFPSSINLAFPWTISFPSSLAIGGGNLSPPGSPSAPARSSITHAGGYTTVAHPELGYERAAVLFAMAALQSSLGVRESRADGESIKRAVAAFATSAGLLSHLLTLVPSLAPTFRASPRTADTDLSPSTLAALRDAMLGQAQECAWSKAVSDRLKDATIAKLAARVEALYASALDAAAGKGMEPDLAGLGGCELPKEWISHLTVKRWHFAAAAQYRKSVDDLGANRYGDEIGRLQLAQTHVKRALDASKARGISPALGDDLRSLQGIITANLARAIKDNDLIYLEPVTPADRLAPINGASMAEARLPPEVKDPIANLTQDKLGVPLFQELVPYGVHLALSIYDDRKDSLVRDEIAAKRDELDGIAASTLQSLNLPGSLQALEQPMGLPTSLLRKSDDVRLEGSYERLISTSRDVQRVAQTDARILREVYEHLEREEREDRQVRADFSEKHFSRLDSARAGAELKQRADEFAETLRQAERSDEVVRAKMDEWEDVIGVLGGGETSLEAFVPSGVPTATSSAPQSQAQIAAARALRVELEGLDDLLDARASLLAEARAKAASDDIRPLVLREAGALAAGSSSASGTALDRQPLVVKAEHFETLFERELEKYEALRREMEHSEKEQEERLERLRVRNDEFIEARKVDTTVKRREQALQMLDMGHSKFREISSNLDEGLKFYNSLARLLSELRQDVKEWHRARSMDVQELVSRFSGTTLSADSPHQAQAQQAQAAPSWEGVRTRSQRASNAPATPGKGQQQQQQEEEQQAPKGGVWPGGAIRFAD